MFDAITSVFLIGLVLFVVLNRKRIVSASEALGNIANDTHVESELRTLKRSCKAEFQTLKNKIEELEKDRPFQPAQQKSRPTQQTS